MQLVNDLPFQHNRSGILNGVFLIQKLNDFNLGNSKGSHSLCVCVYTRIKCRSVQTLG